MRFKQRSPCLFLTALVLLLLPAAALAAELDVFAEGAYTAAALEVRFYANINSGDLCSYGVKLSYDATKLNVPTATKNDDVWYFGTTAAKLAYMNPDTSTAGQVIFIGGKLDTGSPTTGVTGTRILLGKATFTRKENSMGLGTGAQNYFGITVALGKAGNYSNFVSTAGVVRDSTIAFGPNVVRERGDANASGSITVRDIATVKELIGAQNFPVYADCNDSGSITVRDIACIKEKIQ